MSSSPSSSSDSSSSSVAAAQAVQHGSNKAAGHTPLPPPGLTVPTTTTAPTNTTASGVPPSLPPSYSPPAANQQATNQQATNQQATTQQATNQQVQSGHQIHPVQAQSEQVTASVENPYASPSCMEYICQVWLDVVTLLCLSGATLALYLLKPISSSKQLFPVSHTNEGVFDPRYAYPYLQSTIPTWMSAVISVLVPVTVMGLAQIRIRSCWDFNNGVFGLLYAILGTTVSIDLLKCFVGGLRPHFYDICRPDVPLWEDGAGPSHIMYTRKICTNPNQREIDIAMQAFPSGHAGAAFSGFVFLALYLNARLKLWANYHAPAWKLVLVYAPIVGATLIACNMSLDHHHHWYDILVGAAVGTVMAMSAYRMVYASLWSYETNHVPLLRYTPLSDAALKSYQAISTPRPPRAVTIRKAKRGNQHPSTQGTNDQSGNGQNRSVESQAEEGCLPRSRKIWRGRMNLVRRHDAPVPGPIGVVPVLPPSQRIHVPPSSQPIIIVQTPSPTTDQLDGRNYGLMSDVATHFISTATSTDSSSPNSPPPPPVSVRPNTQPPLHPDAGSSSIE